MVLTGPLPRLVGPQSKDSEVVVEGSQRHSG